jgi:biopolymer transport protein ExbD
MRKKRRQHPAEDFQMAPMIDMVFLLLVFFMCVSSLSQAARLLPVELPEAAESRVPEDLSGRAYISLTAEGEMLFGALPVTREELRERLAAALRLEPGLRAQIRADRVVPFSKIREALRACSEAGVADIIYATHQID